MEFNNPLSDSGYVRQCYALSRENNEGAVPLGVIHDALAAALLDYLPLNPWTAQAHLLIGAWKESVQSQGFNPNTYLEDPAWRVERAFRLLEKISSLVVGWGLPDTLQDTDHAATFFCAMAASLRCQRQEVRDLLSRKLAEERFVYHVVIDTVKFTDSIALAQVLKILVLIGQCHRCLPLPLIDGECLVLSIKKAGGVHAFNWAVQEADLTIDEFMLLLPPEVKNFYEEVFEKWEFLVDLDCMLSQFDGKLEPIAARFLKFTSNDTGEIGRWITQLVYDEQWSLLSVQATETLRHHAEAILDACETRYYEEGLELSLCSNWG